MIYRLIIFWVLNFLALAIGGSFTGEGVPSDWYMNLDKAPWTPPGWVFGAAWTTIMVCFGIYMAYVWPTQENKKKLVLLYSAQWVLNVAWNPAFFYYHHVLGGLIIITGLTGVVAFFLFHFSNALRFKSALILPYFIWLIIATSLNGYILLMN